MSKWIICALLLVMSSSTALAEDETEAPDLFGFLTSTEGVYQSQLALQADGSLLMVWVQKGESGFNLFAARQISKAAFSAPIQVNVQPVNGYTGDEARPDIALAPDGSVAIVWTAKSSDTMLVEGSDFGRAFGQPIKLNQDEGEAYRAMPGTAIAPDGSAHTIWLDSRGVPDGMEEPANLYYAVVKDGKVTEVNLTEHQTSTVCGCCRPFIAIDAEGEIDMAFRNQNDDGYRDIWRIDGTPGDLSKPMPTSPPIWKLNACPMAGPIAIDDGTLWKDASTGAWRMLWATDAEKDPEVLFADKNLELTYPPRMISGQADWVLISAKPSSLIATRAGGEWGIVMEGLPDWATSVVVREGQLILVGNKKGRLLTEIRPL